MATATIGENTFNIYNVHRVVMRLQIAKNTPDPMSYGPVIKGSDLYQFLGEGNPQSLIYTSDSLHTNTVIVKYRFMSFIAYIHLEEIKRFFRLLNEESCGFTINWLKEGF